MSDYVMSGAAQSWSSRGRLLFSDGTICIVVCVTVFLTYYTKHNTNARIGFAGRVVSCSKVTTDGDIITTGCDMAFGVTRKASSRQKLLFINRKYFVINFGSVF